MRVLIDWNLSMLFLSLSHSHTHTHTHARTHTRPYTHTPSQCISWVVTPFATLSFSYFNVFHSIKHTSAHTHAHVHSHTNTHTHTRTNARTFFSVVSWTDNFSDQKLVRFFIGAIIQLSRSGFMRLRQDCSDFLTKLIFQILSLTRGRKTLFVLLTIEFVSIEHNRSGA